MLSYYLVKPKFFFRCKFSNSSCHNINFSFSKNYPVCRQQVWSLRCDQTNSFHIRQNWLLLNTYSLNQRSCVPQLTPQKLFHVAMPIEKRKTQLSTLPKTFNPPQKKTNRKKSRVSNKNCSEVKILFYENPTTHLQFRYRTKSLR